MQVSARRSLEESRECHSGCPSKWVDPGPGLELSRRLPQDSKHADYFGIPELSGSTYIRSEV
jgi:hypothetical protein